jgi:hypothetical protein
MRMNASCRPDTVPVSVAPDGNVNVTGALTTVDGAALRSRFVCIENVDDPRLLNVAVPIRATLNVNPETNVAVPFPLTFNVTVWAPAAIQAPVVKHAASKMFFTLRDAPPEGLYMYRCRSSTVRRV